MEKQGEETSLKTRRQKEVERLRLLYEKRPAADDGFNFKGVLLSDAIERCVTAFSLIEPFDPENLKAACYKLTIGDEYAIGGAIHSLSDVAGKNEIRIPPFAVAVIKTHETINMPRFLIGRWNIQVSRAYQGLIWVGGPQVDAGYVGYLFCPIYNLSDQDVILPKGQPIAVIDFVPTTDFHEGRSQNYKFPPKRVLFEEYEPQKLISGLVSKAKQRLDQVEADAKTNNTNTEKRIDSTQQRIDSFISLTFAVVAILFAAITVSAFGKDSPPWSYIGIFLLSGFAVFLAASAWLKSSSEGRLFGRAVQILVLAGLLAAFLVNWFLMKDQYRNLDQLSKDVKELKANLPVPTGATKTLAGPNSQASGAVGTEHSSQNSK
jgi:deoxycytidine triphosphate deaminase